MSEAKATWKTVAEQGEEIRRLRAKVLEYARAGKTLEELKAMSDERHGTGAEILILAAISIAEQRARAKEVWIG